MNCDSNYSLFLRSNGTLVCWDDYGSLRELQAFDPNVDYAKDVYLGPVYEAIREKLRRNEMPFPDHCAKCFCLRAHHAADDGAYVRERRMETFQIEPSMACELACPGCIAPKERKTRLSVTPHGHLTLKPEILYKIAGDLKKAGIRIRKFDLQGHGEPLRNKRVWEMCGTLAGMFPDSIVSICTHANAAFHPSQVRSGVTEILFAIDGVDQESYAPWRINGNFDKAWRFMRDFSQEAAREAPQITRVWKYVLFSHNDSDAHLARAQEMALESKVNTIRFVHTQLGPGSRRSLNTRNVKRIDPSLNIVFDDYRIPAAQLRSALMGLNRAARSAEGWRAWLEMLQTSLHRLFSTNADVSDDYRKIIDETRALLLSLPADPFGTAAGQFETFVAALETAAPGAKTGRMGSASSAPGLPRPAAKFSTLEARAIAASVEVDEAWYLDTYPDVQKAHARGQIDSATGHWRKWGYQEGRLPFQPNVNESWYVTRYPDVAAAISSGRCASATDHFIQTGYREGRDPVLPIDERIRLGVTDPQT